MSELKKLKKHYLGKIDKYEADKWTIIRCAINSLSDRMGVNFTTTYNSGYVCIETKYKINTTEIEYILGYFHGLCLGLDVKLTDFV